MACAYIDDQPSKYKFSSLHIVQQPQQIYLPVTDDEIIAIILLEDAVKPLVQFIPTIYDKVELAKENCKNPSNNLSCDESAAIYLFSMRWKPIDECLYSILNATLRDHNEDKLKPWNLYLRLLFTALNRLPSTKITFYQDIKPHLTEKYSKENFCVFWDFTFCSLSIALSKQFIDQTKKRTIYAFECCNAKFIERHSCNSHQNEILLMPTQFRFIRYLDKRYDLDIIQLKEYDQTLPLIQFGTKPHQPVSNTPIEEVIQATTSDVSYRNPKLEKLISLHQSRSQMNLTFQNLTADDMPIIIAQAIIDKQCTRLLLDNNYMTVECISILVLALSNSKTLKELYLYEAGICDTGVEILAETLAFNNFSINTLGLNKNYITDKGAQHLTEMLKTNTTLTRLHLYGNPISSRGVKLIVNTLRHHNNTLQQLDIDPNKSKTFKSVRTLVNVLRCTND